MIVKDFSALPLRGIASPRLAAAVITALIGLYGAAALFAQQPATSGLSLAEFEKLHKELQPPDNELWRTIPWQVLNLPSSGPGPPKAFTNFRALSNLRT